MNVDGKINNSRNRGDCNSWVVDVIELPCKLLAIPQGIGVDTNMPSHIYACELSPGLGLSEA